MMTSPRISPAQPPYEPAIADAFARVMPSGVEPLTLFRTMARSPRVLQRMFAGSLLDKGAITFRDRELMILRTCARCGAEYEWGVHVTFFAQKAELTDVQVRATVSGATEDSWSSRDRLVLQMADALHDGAAVSDALWDELKGVFSDEQLLELIALAGYYRTISYMVNACRLAPEPYAARFAKA
jgi:alkylhydroperoxidase family enzyme